MGRQNFGFTHHLFAVAGAVGGNLGGGGSGHSVFLEVLVDLLPPRTRRFKIFLRISANLWSAAFPGLQLVAEIAKSVRQLGLIDGGSVLLAIKQRLRLKRVEFAIRAPGHVEDDDVGMQLRGRISVNWPRCLMLEFGRNQLAGGL